MFKINNKERIRNFFSFFQAETHGMLNFDCIIMVSIIGFSFAGSETQFHQVSPGQPSLGVFIHINQSYKNASLLIYTNKNY